MPAGALCVQPFFKKNLVHFPFVKNQINLAGVIILEKTLTQTCFFSLQFHKKNYVIVLFKVTFFSNIEN